MVSTITARELRNVRLTTTYLSAGYNIVEVNEFYCKGCGICSRECWTGAFQMVPLTEGETKKEEKK